MWIYIISAILLIVLLYTVVPYALSRGIGLKVMKRGKMESKIAFTFDDGPDPLYTPMLLDVLKEHDVKATFFVVGSKAKKNREILQRMHREGHLIGIHNYVHQSNWLMSPWKVRKGVEETDKVIEGAIGMRTSFYRPPWGMLNLFDFIKGKYHYILWSISAQDWRSAGGSEKIKDKLSKIQGGDIILLHDCGDTPGADIDAPLNTINALNDVLKTVKSNGLTCVRIDELNKQL